jgi:hypothetical protein
MADGTSDSGDKLPGIVDTGSEAKMRDAAVENQGGKAFRGKDSDPVLKGVPSAEQLLGKGAGAVGDSGREQLRKEGLIDPATGRSKELESAAEVNKLIKSGFHDLFAQQRTAEFEEALGNRDKDRLQGILARNTREIGHYQTARDGIQANLTRAETRLT